MGKPVISITDRDRFRVVNFEIPDTATTPAEFAQAVEEIARLLPGPLPVLLSGRGPIWGYGMLIHAAHATPAIATFDPRLDGYVVVASHNARFLPGQIVANSVSLFDPNP